MPFELDDYTRWRLLEGLDDIGLTLRHADDDRGVRGSAVRRRLPVDASRVERLACRHQVRRAQRCDAAVLGRSETGDDDEVPQLIDASRGAPGRPAAPRRPRSTGCCRRDRRDRQGAGRGVALTGFGVFEKRPVRGAHQRATRVPARRWRSRRPRCPRFRPARSSRRSSAAAQKLAGAAAERQRPRRRSAGRVPKRAAEGRRRRPRRRPGQGDRRQGDQATKATKAAAAKKPRPQDGRAKTATAKAAAKKAAKATRPRRPARRTAKAATRRRATGAQAGVDDVGRVSPSGASSSQADAQQPVREGRAPTCSPCGRLADGSTPAGAASSRTSARESGITLPWLHTAGDAAAGGELAQRARGRAAGRQ